MIIHLLVLNLKVLFKYSLIHFNKNFLHFDLIHYLLSNNQLKQNNKF